MSLKAPARTGYEPRAFFQVMFILQNAPNRAEELPGLRLEQLDVDMGTATFDLTLSMAEELDGFDASVEYNTDIFDATTIERLLRHFRNLLEGAVAMPDQSISRLPLLGPAERQQVLFEWNDTAPPGRLARAPARCSRSGSRTPDAPAVVAGGASHLCGVECANQLAYHLRKLGVVRRPVGIAAEKSLETIVAVLGVMAAGGATRPSTPPIRPTALPLLEDSGAQISHPAGAGSWKLEADRRSFAAHGS